MQFTKVAPAGASGARVQRLTVEFAEVSIESVFIGSFKAGGFMEGPREA